MRHTSIVYLSLGQLLLRPPRSIPYHRMARSVWPVYVNGKRKGIEAHWTACGLLVYQSRPDEELGIATRGLDGIRLDNARLVARPCWKCWA